MQDITKAKITDLLPHRPPFLFVDRIIEYKEGESIKALKRYTINEDYFRGHFPDTPIVPGVLMVESIAQAAGILAMTSFNKDGFKKPEIFFLSRISAVKFRKPVVPGDELIIEVNLIKEMAGSVKVSALGKVKEEIVIEAELMLSKKP